MVLSFCQQVELEGIIPEPFTKSNSPKPNWVFEKSPAHSLWQHPILDDILEYIAELRRSLDRL